MEIGKLWSKVINDKNLNSEEVADLASWAMRVYFGDKSRNERWFREGVTKQDVLQEFLKPTSPMSPSNLVEFWSALPGIQRTMRTFGSHDLDNLLSVLENGANRYNKGEVTLREMSEEMGGVTTTMVNKIFASGAAKIRALTKGRSLYEIEPHSLAQMMMKIEETREESAQRFASTLKVFEEDVGGFLDNQVQKHHMTQSERESLSNSELELLKVLSTLKEEEIIRVLLADILDENNLFKSFQNCASRRLFRHRRLSLNTPGKHKQTRAHAAPESPPTEDYPLDVPETTDLF